MSDCFCDASIVEYLHGEFPMAVMDMPTDDAHREMETTIVVAIERDFHLDHCVFPCHDRS